MLDTTIAVMRALSRPDAGARTVRALFSGLESDAVRWESRTVGENGATTDLVRVTVGGARGRLAGGDAPTLGVIGRLGGVGARPSRVGLVSDGDGAAAALSVALEAARMAEAGDRLAGDVIVSTHVCPRAPVVPHDPVPFMGSPVDMATKNEWDVRPEMEAILSIDTTKGNRILNHRGIAITPTVKEGWVLKVASRLVDAYEAVCGIRAHVLPITTQDILPYGTGIDHINSLMQPATATCAPVVGVAITAETTVAGCQTGASHPADVELAARYALEVARAFGEGELPFYDAAEFDRIVGRYGPLTHLQGMGRARD